MESERGKKQTNHLANTILALAWPHDFRHPLASNIQRVKVCCECGASCGCGCVCLVCVLNVSGSDVKLYVCMYADANRRVSMCVWEGSSVEHRGFQNFLDNAKYELKAKTKQQKNRKASDKYIFKNINIHNKEEATGE